MNFPRTLFEFQGQFGTEEGCRSYLTALRWPDGFSCPRCGMEARNYLEGRQLWVCKLGHQTSLTADTVMHRSHLSLRHWFWAAWLQTTQTPGISSVVLARKLGVKQESAYMMLQRLRAGLVDPQSTQLHGAVEVDEAYISAGRVRRVRGGRGSGKPIVVGAVEVHGEYAGRVRLRRINSAGEADILPFVRKHVGLGTRIVTDGWPSYSSLPEYGYGHHVVMGADSKEIALNLPHIHRVFSLLKAWLIGTHHGVSSKHLQAYLNEFTYRYNHRRNPMKSFMRALGISSHVEGPEYEELYSAGEPDGWVHSNPLEVLYNG
jgi:transposase-like protein